jgi:hypothetical protein
MWYEITVGVFMARKEYIGKRGSARLFLFIFTRLGGAIRVNFWGDFRRPFFVRLTDLNEVQRLIANPTFFKDCEVVFIPMRKDSIVGICSFNKEINKFCVNGGEVL